ncbi:DUF6708 domain-containing protein, partial [Mangrovibacter phragmitis]|uniref:DUF6708 domain-containing protein n=1 Tax=Mangrovibacter phragmitis TaxID=1691903 RepID=UPI002F916149
MGISHDIGLFFPFKVNRSLTAEEKKRRFVQGRRRRCPGEAAVLDFETVIRINSSYLEVVDKYYALRGMATSFIMGFCILLIGFIIAMGKNTILNEGSVSFFVFLLTVCSGCLFFLIRILLKEWFRYTHYPVRFNRKTRQVHIFQVSGEIITVPWNKIYFTTNRQRLNECIVGHILAEDNDTVLNTFSFGHVGTRDELSRYWEFIRCYMEEDCVAELA